MSDFEAHKEEINELVSLIVNQIALVAMKHQAAGRPFIQHAGITTMAIEIVASIQRRQARDIGFTADMVHECRHVASDIARQIYEHSGAGKNVRAMRESQALRKEDAHFTKEQTADAAKLATEAIAAALGRKKA